MELRHLETLIAIDEEGTFTAAADMLRTVQSNVSEQVRQLEAELGVTLLVRGRSGRDPDRVRRASCSTTRAGSGASWSCCARTSRCCRGSQVGNASFGIVGTASRWLVPALVADLRARAPGHRAARERGRVGAAARRGAATRSSRRRSSPSRCVTSGSRSEHLLDEALVGLAPPGTELPPEPVPFEALAEMRAGPAARRATRCASRSSTWRGRAASRCRCRSRSKASG